MVLTLTQSDPGGNKKVTKGLNAGFITNHVALSCFYNISTTLQVERRKIVELRDS